MADLREALIRAEGKPLRDAMERSQKRIVERRKGAETLRLVWQGAWNASTAYIVGDVVEYEGSSWRAKSDNKDQAPPADPDAPSLFWELVAERGRNGSSGVPGYDGAQGLPGPQGIPGDPGPGTPLTIEDEGVAQGIATTVDFVGPGVTATVMAGVATVNVPSSGGHVIEDEGVPLAQRADLNFVGAGVTAADAGGKTVITIPGGTVNFDDPVESQFGDSMSQGVDPDSSRADHKHDRHDDAILFLTRMI